MNTMKSYLRSVRRLAGSKGFVLRKLRGSERYTLGCLVGLASKRPLMHFESLDQVLSEIRMH